MVMCQNCGGECREGSKFCYYCGAPMTEEAAREQVARAAASESQPEPDEAQPEEAAQCVEAQMTDGTEQGLGELLAGLSAEFDKLAVQTEAMTAAATGQHIAAEQNEMPTAQSGQGHDDIQYEFDNLGRSAENLAAKLDIYADLIEKSNAGEDIAVDRDALSARLSECADYLDKSIDKLEKINSATPDAAAAGAAVAGAPEQAVSPYARTAQPARYVPQNTAQAEPSAAQPAPTPTTPGYNQAESQNYRPGFTGIRQSNDGEDKTANGGPAAAPNVYTAQGNGPAAAQNGGPADAKMSDKNWAAILSLIAGVLSIFSVITCFGPLVLGIAAIIFGIFGLNSEKRSMAVGGIVCGGVSIALLLILIIVIIVMS